MLTKGGNKYFFHSSSDNKGYAHVDLMGTKDKVFDIFRIFKQLGGNKKQKRNTVLRNDKGGKYSPLESNNFCEENEMIYKKKCIIHFTQKWISQKGKL